MSSPGAWLQIGDQQIHLLELPNPDPVTGRPEHGDPGTRPHGHADSHLAPTLLDLLAEDPRGPSLESVAPECFDRLTAIAEVCRARLREEMQATGGDWLQSLRNTQNTTGSAVIVSIIVLLGSFIPLVGTTLANTWGLSIYIGWALIIDVFTALMLLPLMVKWFKPKYVFDAN